MSHSPSRRRTRLVLGALAGAALVVATPLAASAHVHVTPDSSETGTTTRLSFSFSHGCDDSPTTSLTVTIPEGIDGATPVLDGAWTITREIGDDGIPTSVTYTAVTPVESGISATISLDVIFASSAAGTSVAFPVLQSCAVGETDWSEVAADGQSEDDLESPAPVVMVGENEADEDATDDADTAGEADPVARWLSGGALVAALAALGVALFGRRKA
ncbi:MAG: DUF1775 domain-containing protein [Microbacterium sp.]